MKFFRLFLVLVTFETAFGEEGKPLTFYKDLTPHLSVERAFDLTGVQPGKKIEARVYIRNRRRSSVTFQTVHTGCKCTTANVPKITLNPGDEVECAFAFDITPNPRKAEEIYTTSILCAEEPNLVSIAFRIQWTGIVAFERSEMLIPYTSDVAMAQFRIPLETIDPDHSQRAQFSVSDEIGFVISSVKILDGKAWFVGDFSTKVPMTDRVVGELSVTTDDGRFSSNILLTFVKEQNVSVIPSRIMFVPTDEIGFSRHAVAVVKLRSIDTTKTPTIRDVKCHTSSGAELETRLGRVTSQTYRVELFAEDVHQIRPDDKLKWTIVNGTGGVVLVETNQFFGR